MSLLSLILEHAPVEAFHAEQERMLAARGDEGREEVLAEVQRALLVHGQLREGRHRAVELTALNDLSRKLTAIRDHEALLQEVAVQARRLLGSDVAYIMLVEHRDTLRIRVVDGAMGHLLRNIELGRGVGIGGKVLETGQPLWSSDYVGDQSLAHDQGVDKIASAEQLQSILGVPLRLDEETIGVLLIAQHQVRQFSDADILLLSALAAPAAVALHNAAIFDQLDDSNSRLRREHEASQSAARLHDRMMADLLDGRGVAALCDTMAEELGGEVTFSEGAEPHGQEQTRSPGTRQSRVMAGALQLGTLRLTRDTPVDQETVHMLERGATAVALALTTERMAVEAERRSRSELVTALLGTDAPEAVLRRRAQAAGMTVGSIRSLVVLDSPARTLPLAEALAGRTEGWAGMHRDSVVLLSPLAPEDVVVEVSHELGEIANAAVSPCADPFAGWRHAYEDARSSLQLLSALGRKGTCVRSEELGVTRSLLSHVARADVESLIRSQIGPLIQRDQSRGSHLLETLEVYLGRTQHHNTTARALGIHTNTLYQRLERIDELLGPDWRTPARSLDIQLALRLWRLSNVDVSTD